jgi:hypothetical protein
MFKTRCESCSRLIVCEAVKGEGKSFCAYDCRLSWIRAMRRFELGAKQNPVVGKH